RKLLTCNAVACAHHNTLKTPLTLSCRFCNLCSYPSADTPLILIEEEKTWREALRYCRENHVDLVSVENETIQRWVKILAKTASTDNSWIWSDGIDDSYNNWTPGQPDSLNSEKCVMLRSVDEYKWHNADCSIQNLFICYKGE
uniref:C-type lectin domain-containing protein n=1 Tax=Astyanax mexicanus TaxID=7994 RepID=A0A3B1JED2_ASTMX